MPHKDMTPEEILARRTKIALMDEEVRIEIPDNFFRYKCGKLGKVYYDMEPVFFNPRACSTLASMMSYMLRQAVDPPEIVLSVEEATVFLVGQLALCLSNECSGRRIVRSLYFSRGKKECPVYLKRDALRIARNKKVFLVAGVTTTGSSIARASDYLRTCGCNILGASVVVNLAGVNAEQCKVPYLCSLLEEDEHPITEEEFQKIPNVIINKEYGKEADPEQNPNSQ